MVTSRSRPKQIAQIFSPFAGQKRFGGRFSQIAQLIQSPWEGSGPVGGRPPESGEAESRHSAGERLIQAVAVNFPAPIRMRPVAERKFRARVSVFQIM